MKVVILLNSLANAFAQGFNEIKKLNKKRMAVEGAVVHGYNEAAEHAYQFKKELHHELVEKPEHNRRKATLLGKREAITWHAEQNVNEFAKQHPITNKQNLQLKVGLIKKREHELNKERKSKLKQVTERPISLVPKTGNIVRGMKKDAGLVANKISNPGVKAVKLIQNVSVTGEPFLKNVSKQVKGSNSKVRKSYTINKQKFKLAYLSKNREDVIDFAEEMLDRNHKILKKVTPAGYAVYVHVR